MQIYFHIEIHLHYNINNVYEYKIKEFWKLK